MDYNISIRVDTTGKKGNDFKNIGKVSDAAIKQFLGMQLSSQDFSAAQLGSHENNPVISRLKAFAFQCEQEKNTLDPELARLQAEQAESRQKLAPLEMGLAASIREIEVLEITLKASASKISFQANEAYGRMESDAEAIRGRLKLIAEQVRKDTMEFGKKAHPVMAEFENLMNQHIQVIRGGKAGILSIGMLPDPNTAETYEDYCRMQQAGMYQNCLKGINIALGSALVKCLPETLRDIHVDVRWLEKLHAGASNPEIVTDLPQDLRDMLNEDWKPLRNIASDLEKTAKTIKGAMRTYEDIEKRLKKAYEVRKLARENSQIPDDKKPSSEEVASYKKLYDDFSIATDCISRTHILMIACTKLYANYIDGIKSFVGAAQKLQEARKAKTSIETQIAGIEAKDNTAQIGSLKLRINSLESAMASAKEEIAKLEFASEKKRKQAERHIANSPRKAPEPDFNPCVHAGMFEASALSQDEIGKRIGVAVSSASNHFSESLRKYPKLTRGFEIKVQRMAEIYAKNNGRLEASDIVSAFGAKNAKLLPPMNSLQFMKIAVEGSKNGRMMVEMSNPLAPVICFLGKRHDKAKPVNSYDLAVGRNVYWLFPGILEPPKEGRAHEENIIAAPVPEQQAEKESQPAGEITAPKAVPLFSETSKDPLIIALADVIRHKKILETLDRLTEQLKEGNQVQIGSQIQNMRREINRTWKTGWKNDWESLLHQASTAQALSDVSRVLVELKQPELLQELAAHIVLYGNVKMDDKVHVQLSRIDGNEKLLYEMACASILKVGKKIGDSTTWGLRTVDTETDRITSIMNVLVRQDRFEEIYQIARKAYTNKSKYQPTIDLCENIVEHAKGIFELAEENKYRDNLKPKFMDWYSTLYPTLQ